MEDPELAVLADLINSDNDFDDNELDNLSNGEEPVNSTPVRSRNMSNSNGKEISNNPTTNNGDPSNKITEMENYIKFLESQLRTQNNEKSKSSETANTSANNKRSSPDEQKYKIENKMGKNDKMSVENHKKENIKKHNTLESTKASSATQISLDSGLVKKPRIAHAPKSTQSSSIQQNESRVSGTKRKAEAPVSQSSTAKRPAQDLNGVTDSFSGLRIVNPLISSATMERRMEGRKMIKISSIQSRIRNNDIEGDWVTIGVVIQKLPPKTSSKGNQYSIWKLSDLAFHMENAIVSLFLFGESHKEHWKTSEGTVIAVLNPSILPARDKQSKDIALSVDNPKKMMLMGVSQDFGRCQSARKADGAKCSNFVNKAQGDFCEYHVRREYSKMRSKRMECQQGYGAPSKPHGKNLKQKVSAESFFYEGRTVSSYTSPLQKEKVTLKSLAANAGKEHLNSWKGKQEENKDPDYKDGPSQEFLNLLKIPSVGSRNLMRQLHQEEEKEEKETQKTISASEFLKANKIQRRSGPVSRPFSTVTRTFGEATSSKNTSGPLFKTPVLGRGLNCDDDLIFDENIPLNFTGENVAFDKGKKRALALVREAGPFNPKDPNDARAKKPSPKQQNAIKAKLGADESKG